MSRVLILTCSAILALAACDSQTRPTKTTATVTPTGLTTSTTTVAPLSEKPARFTADDVLITEGDLDGRPYEILTAVKVSVSKATILHPMPSREQVIAKLQQVAAKRGASAVIHTKISEPQVGPISFGKRTATGVAVRLTE